MRDSAADAIVFGWYPNATIVQQSTQWQPAEREPAKFSAPIRRSAEQLTSESAVVRIAFPVFGFTFSIGIDAIAVESDTTVPTGWPAAIAAGSIRVPGRFQ